jgi:Icc-related predicted phosphoesterase
MPNCLFVSDLHGDKTRYEKLFSCIADERPEAVFLGGDLLPHVSSAFLPATDDGPFVTEYLAGSLERLRLSLSASRYPQIYAIMGNDDARIEERGFEELEEKGLWYYAHNRRFRFSTFDIFGYAYVPPSPFLLKDWERYDVSRFVDPGSVSPEEGRRSVPVSVREQKYATIEGDLKELASGMNLSQAICLFHAPPYQTNLDRAALDGRAVDHAPLDVHVGSIAIRRFIEKEQPLLTLHGHIHESARITGDWKDKTGRTHCITAAHDGKELALIRFDPERPEDATRSLI